MKAPLVAHSIAIALILGISAGLSAQNALAIVIGFESSEGYSTTGGAGGNGNLKGQPSSGTTWTNATAIANLVVTANAGTTGADQALVANASGAAGFYTFTPTNLDLGGTFNSTSSQLAFSFDYNLSAAVSAQTGVSIIRIGTTSGSVLSFSLFSDGMITFSDGAATNPYVKTANGTTNFQAAAGVYYTIGGIIDYATQTYTLTVNGVAQSGGADGVISFRASTSTVWNDFNISSVNVTSGNWRSYAIDNISYALVPEPSTLALVVLGGGGLIWMLRRRRVGV